MARATTPAAPAGRPRLLNENFSRTYAELWNEEGIMQNCQLKVRLHIITQPHQSRDNSNITISQSNVSSVFCIFLPSDPYTSQSNLGYLAGRLGCFATDHFFSLTELSGKSEIVVLKFHHQLRLLVVLQGEPEDGSVARSTKGSTRC